MCLGIFQGFDVIVDLHRDHTGFLRNVATNHQHYTEFAHCMGKPENRSGNKTWTCQRQSRPQLPW